ncbi:MAG: DHH family phosphoesterase [Oscillospiraceae bacterium]|nr:DHH family phosphoesterase [Oscillospiraceae bacterium]
MKAEQCAKLLLRQDRILLVTHNNPDGDTAASAAALCSALRRQGKTAFLYPNPQLGARLRAYAEQFFAPADFTPAYTVTVDVATEKMFARGFEGKVDLAIDHHPTNSHYAKAACIDDRRAACGEIVLQIIKAMGGVTKEEADMLYVALSTDCGCFQYANTDAHAFRSAAELLELGADNADINQVFFRQVSPARLKLEGMIYSGMRFYHDGKIAVNFITQQMLRETGVMEEELDDVAGLVGRARGHRVGITIRENPDGTSKISARCGPDFDVSALCAVFGGGGHKMAAGCNIHEKPERACELLLQVIEELWA